MDDVSHEAESVSPTDRVEREDYLESLFVKNPGMLMPDLKLVGRQTPTDSGNLDLLGVDGDGTLVVFELKRGKSTRDAVAQVIDYCFFLESLSDTDLAELVAKYSGKNGIDPIGDFEAWYGEQYEGKDLSELRPIRMVLVGVGADAPAQRMVGFLAEREVDVSLLTFHGYRYGDRTLLARQLEGGEFREMGSSSRRRRAAERRRRHEELTEQIGIADVWRDAVNKLSVADRERVRKSGITYHMRKIELGNINPTGSHSIVIDEERQMIRITFYPASIHLCWNTFQKWKKKNFFEFETPPNAPVTDKVSEQWYCLLDKKSWELHREALATLANEVTSAWRKKRDEAKA